MLKHISLDYAGQCLYMIEKMEREDEQKKKINQKENTLTNIS